MEEVRGTKGKTNGSRERGGGGKRRTGGSGVRGEEGKRRAMGVGKGKWRKEKSKGSVEMGGGK
jgi:hypothetical protein